MFKNPDHHCCLCPRLAEFRNHNQSIYPTFHNGPVDSFGPLDAKLLVLGLAPGLKGANATGRPFTGDYAGDLLYDTLLRFDLASGHYDKHKGDSLTLQECRVSNAVRCVPPQNKPTPQEINTCRPFLIEELKSMTALKVIICLGRISHDSALKTLGVRLSQYPFGHAAHHRIKPDQNHALHGREIDIIDSYHCSRYNTNTGRLTPAMFDDVFVKAKRLL